jgi:hypothetical protein
MGHLSRPRKGLLPMSVSCRASASSHCFSQSPFKCKWLFLGESMKRYCSACKKSPFLTRRVVMAAPLWWDRETESVSLYSPEVPYLWNAHLLYIYRHFSSRFFLSHIVLSHTVVNSLLYNKVLKMEFTGWGYSPVVEHLPSMRGIDTVSSIARKK